MSGKDMVDAFAKLEKERALKDILNKIFFAENLLDIQRIEPRLMGNDVIEDARGTRYIKLRILLGMMDKAEASKK